MSLLFPRVAFYPAQSSHCGRRQASFNPAAAHPFFQALEETLGELAGASRSSPAQRAQHCQRLRQQHQARIFNPRFDVQEVSDSYILEGELPGVEQDNISIEFLDEATLQITGHRESHSAAPTSTPAEPAQEQEQETTQKDDASTIVDDAASTKSTFSSTFKHATVEDEEAVNEWIDIPTSSDEHAKPASEKAEEVAAPTETPVEQPQQTQQKSWLKERSHGSFNRTFRFESRVDRDNVKASLKNGLLTVTVPKAAVPEVRRIRID